MILKEFLSTLSKGITATLYTEDCCDPLIAFTTNERLMTPQFYKGSKENITGLASAGYNHLVLGMVDKWGKFVGNEEDMLKELKR